MSAQVINGKELVQTIRSEIAEEVKRLAAQGVQPGLAVVLAGDDPASDIYVRNKAKACENAGMYSEVYRLPTETTQEQLLQLIDRLNAEERIHGILVQSPLPGHLDEKTVVKRISPDKDVDCFHPLNVGNLVIGESGFLPCTPAGVIEIMKRIGVDMAGKHAVIIGRSNIVGKPMAFLLLRENATVTICHSKTQNLPELTKQADILISAVGRAKTVNRSHVKPGAVVIDVGINRLDNGKVVGDVDFEDVIEVAGYITPVPGVVGPMTITMLLQNTLRAAKRKRQ